MNITLPTPPEAQDEYVKELELENWTHKREIAKLKSDMAQWIKADDRRRRNSSQTYAELERVKADKVELQKELFESHKKQEKLEEQVAVLKRANEINEKQIRDYERDQVDEKRPNLEVTTPAFIPTVPYSGAIYGISMR
jgi:hypothetical protein